ncbi:MAG: hypothetical protein WBA66_06990 [Xanthobacteraceae bacterium]
MSLEIVVPVLMGAALLWYIGRGIDGRQKLIAAAVTLAIVLLIIALERGGWIAAP